MSVNPGFGGQSFIASQLRKIEAIRKMIDKSGRDIRLEVDGGIDADTAPLAIAAGADVLVAGPATFKGGPDAYAGNIRSLRRASHGRGTPPDPGPRRPSSPPVRRYAAAPPHHRARPAPDPPASPHTALARLTPLPTHNTPP